MKFSTALARLLAVGVLMALAGHAAAQQAYPSKPIRIIVPFPPGGTTDASARLIGPKLAESWGQPVIVDNRPGGNTTIGTNAAAKAAPDGYTILLSGNGDVINDLLRRLPYNLFKDFAPVSILVKLNYILALHPSVPANNLQEFIAFAKSRPGLLNVASVSSGTAQHLMAELFNILAGVKMQHIPYKGGAQVITDLIGGQVQASFANTINVTPHIKSGKLKGLAVTGDKRLAALPQLPTYAEAGLAIYDPKNWLGIVAPAGTPKEVVDKLSIEAGKILAMADVKEKLANSGMEPFPSTPEQMAAQMKSDHAEYAKVISIAKIKVED